MYLFIFLSFFVSTHVLEKSAANNLYPPTARPQTDELNVLINKMI